MHVRLLRGLIIGIDAYGINDFETIPDGDVTDITLGVSLTGGCNWGDTTLVQL